MVFRKGQFGIVVLATFGGIASGMAVGWALIDELPEHFLLSDFERFAVPLLFGLSGTPVSALDQQHRDDAENPGGSDA